VVAHAVEDGRGDGGERQLALDRAERLGGGGHTPDHGFDGVTTNCALCEFGR
jgi:hypothetical protein